MKEKNNKINICYKNQKYPNIKILVSKLVVNFHAPYGNMILRKFAMNIIISGKQMHNYQEI